ncbi:MAG: VWA domain-containing protein [Brevinematales bacterium]|nr:VWA domain-containing protein [Brevinematales bacterium]
MKRIPFFVVILVLMILTFFSKQAYSENYIIVIDTSLSMNRKVIDGVRVYDVALRSLSNFIFSLKNGDIVYIVDFNEIVNIRPPIEIKDEYNKEVIYKVMSGTQPYGKWTFTYKMLEEVANLIKVSNMSSQNTKVIIISDGIDDPPIKTKKYIVDLEKLSTLFEPQQLVYFISLEKLISKTPQKKESQLSKALKEVEQVKFIEVDLTNHTETLITETVLGKNVTLYLIIPILLILLLLLLLTMPKIYIVNKSKKVSNISVLKCSSDKFKKDITIKGYKIVISSSKGKVTLPNWTYNGYITIRATRKGYRIFFSKKDNVTIPNGTFLFKGMRFAAGNYIFEVD